MFRRALAARPGDVVALRGLGRASEAVGDTAAAEAALRRATELEPSFAAISQLAILYFDLGRYGEAADTFRKASRAAPDSYAALSNAGGAETMRCNYPAALEAYRKALALDPKSPEAATNLGMTELWTGHTAEAVATLERAAQHFAERASRIWGNLGDAYRWAQAPAGKAEAATRSRSPSPASSSASTPTTARRSASSPPASRRPAMPRPQRSRCSTASRSLAARIPSPSPTPPPSPRSPAATTTPWRCCARRLRPVTAPRSSRASPSSRASATTRTSARSSPRREKLAGS